MMPKKIRNVLKALAERLGIVGAVRFLQLFKGEGDYTRDRDKFLGDNGVEELVEEIKARRKHEG